MPPETVNVHFAKTHLSKLLERVRRGQVITIAKAGKPIARLVPLDQNKARTPGGFHFQLDDDFFAPLLPRELKAWEK